MPALSEASVNGAAQAIAAEFSNRVGLRERAAYALGDFAFNLIWTTTLSYITFYYTDVYRIPAVGVAAITLICRLANAVIDPLIGITIDRQHGREKARPYLKWGVAPLALATWLAFVPLGETTPVKIAWALFSFLLLSVTYSLVNVAYGMLTNLMTPEAGSRLRLSSARFIGAAIGSVSIGWTTLSAVKWLGQGDQRSGFMTFMGLVGLCAAACLLITRHYCHERVTYEARHEGQVRALLGALFTNRPWVLLTFTKFLGAIASTATLGMVTYAAIYVLGYGVAFGGTLIAVLTGTAFAGCWLAPAVAEWFGCRATVAASNLLQASCLLFVALVPVSQAGLLVSIGLVGLLMGVRDPVTYTMLSDTIDYGTRRTGVQAIGIAYSCTTAAYKVAAGVGGALVAGVLGWSGYVGGAAVQSEAVLTAIRAGFAWLPALILASAAAVICLYPADAVIRDGLRENIARKN